MWRLDYRECNITRWHRRYYIFKTSIISKIIDLKKSHYDDIEITALGSSHALEDCDIWKLDYRECNITVWRRSYFAKKSDAQAYIKYLKKHYWEYFELNKVSVLDLLKDKDISVL